ncbi:MAG: hypothetical protein JW850_20755 [Thermoflexales bacterium]|nr:hypothetical protein [Thermoflexales bacterium]
MEKVRPSDPIDEFILVTTGMPLVDFGEVTLHRAFIRFYRYLAVSYVYQGETVVETLTDAEAWMLAQVLMLRQDHQYVLRLSNLPMSASGVTRDRYMAKLRRMGLVFTRRLYYTRAQMARVFGPDNIPSTPRQYAQQWDVSSLFHNLNTVARHYLALQDKVDRQWAASGRRGERPVVTLPSDYLHEVHLPLLVAQRLVGKKYDPMPSPDQKGPAWVEIARAMVEENQPGAPHQIDAVRDTASAPPQIDVVRGGDFEPHHVKLMWSLTIPLALTPAAAGGPLRGPAGGPSDSISAPETEGGASQLTLGFFGSEPGDSSAGARAEIAPGRSSALGQLNLTVSSDSEQAIKAFSSLIETVRDRTGTLPPGLRAAALSLMTATERRRRVLDDLRRMQAREDLKPSVRRQKIGAILAQNIGVLIGLGLEPGGRVRMVPQESDYAAVLALAKEHGVETVWITACEVAGAAIEGDPLDYLRSALHNLSCRTGQGKRGRGRDSKDASPRADLFEQVDYERFEN